MTFWIRAPVDGLVAGVIKTRAAGGHEEWDKKVAGVKTNFARQLEMFASGVEPGDSVITFDPERRDVVLVGRAINGYRYEDPPSILGHPHVRDVAWLGTVTRAELPAGGEGIARTRGVTVRRLSDVSVRPTTKLDDAPAAIQPATPFKPRARASQRDHFEWEPTAGAHRHVLRHTFRSHETASHPFAVVMLNPAANHLPGFRRSTTCHAVRPWGEAHDYDGAVYVNLFSHIETNSARLHRVVRSELNGLEADEAIKAIGASIRPGVVIAGWGNLPPGLDRATYDQRVATVEHLLGNELMCLGFTHQGYPRHGRGWHAEDELTTLHRQLTSAATDHARRTRSRD